MLYKLIINTYSKGGGIVKLAGASIDSLTNTSL